ncbi:hypothetical protein D3C78_1906450 [compost metagenome]
MVTELPIVDNGSHLLKGLEYICKVSKLDVREFRANPWQIGEILQGMLTGQVCPEQA